MLEILFCEIRFSFLATRRSLSSNNYLEYLLIAKSLIFKFIKIATCPLMRLYARRTNDENSTRSKNIFMIRSFDLKTRILSVYTFAKISRRAYVQLRRHSKQSIRETQSISSTLGVESEKCCEPIDRLARGLKPVDDRLLICVAERHPADHFVMRFKIKIVRNNILITRE
jgi:hypothetical protein